MLNFEAAAAYAEKHGLEALYVTCDGAPVFERYAAGFSSETVHALYSGTKSFWGPVALAAERDGLITLDECVAATVPEWSEGARSRVTLRMLLSLTSGIGFGGLGNAVPNYERALATELKTEPGTTFTYGGIPLQVFGAVLARKLAATGRTPHDYLRERIFEPLGLSVARWRSLPDGTRTLPTGAFLCAREWAKYGEYVLANETELAPCFTASAANPKYGLGFWLGTPGDEHGPVYASGAGGQALYVLRASRCVIVKFARGSSFNHDAFLRRLLTPLSP